MSEVELGNTAPDEGAIDPKVAEVDLPKTTPLLVPKPDKKSVKIFVSVKTLALGTNAKNSRSVHLTQKKLIEKGFLDAGTDNLGTFGEGTKKALEEYCGCGLTPCVPTIELISKLFTGTEISVIK